MGRDPQVGAGPEYISAKINATGHQEAANEAGVWELGLPSTGGGNGGSGL